MCNGLKGSDACRLTVGNKDKSGVDHLSFVDLLALANNASSVFLSRQTGIDKGKEREIERALIRD